MTLSSGLLEGSRGFCLGLALLCAAAPRAAGVQGSPESLVAPREQAGVTREQAERRITELEAAPDLDEALRARLIELYRQIVQKIDAEEKSAEQAEAYRLAIEAAPAERDRARAELAEGRAAPAEGAERPAGVTLAELEQQRTQLQATVARLRSQQSELARLVGEERSQPAQATSQLAAARAALQQIAGDLGAAPQTDAPESERAARWLLLARQQARTAEVAMLEQELLSNAVRVELLEARRDLAAWKVAQADARVARLEGWISELRLAEAEQARLEADRLQAEATGKHELIREITDQIADLTLETERILPLIDAVREKRLEVEADIEKTQQDYDETRSALELGIGRSLGTVLLEQRRMLPNARSYRRTAAERSRLVMAERLENFTTQREIAELADPGPTLAKLMLRESARELSDADRASLREELEALLATKREHLEALEKSRRNYLEALADLESRESERWALAAELASILDERLLWIPNASPIGLATLSRLQGDLLWLASPMLWGEVLAVGLDDFGGVHVLVGLVLAGLFLTRRRSRARLREITMRVDKVRSDSILLTLEVLALHVLNTLPVPAAMAFVGWRLIRAELSTDASKAVGAGIVTAFAIVFAFQLLRDSCRPSGVALGHFGWRQRNGQLVRRHLLWYLAIAPPTSFVVALTQALPDLPTEGQSALAGRGLSTPWLLLREGLLVREGFGRVAFITLMIAAAVLGLLLLHPKRGLIAGSLAGGAVWLRRTRPAWLPLGMAVPLGLAAMAAAGYYYAALQLELRLNQSVAIILSAVFVHAFLLRWLMISQRRLAMKVAMEKRAALIKNRESAEGEPAADDAVDVVEGIDVAEIKEQTQELLRFSIGFFLVVGLWLAWVSVLPALGVLDDVKLWYHTVVVDGQPERVWITLADLGVALLIVLITITAARNMPGLLEIALLQRLPVDTGVRYATRALVLYAIVAAGFVLAFNAVGVRWSSVQWLVAALTVGLGFGLQEIFANFVSGLIILLERPIRVGDTVTVAQVSGVVSRIRMRATTITDWKRRELVVPNKNFITSELINWSLSDPILRLEFTVGIAYGSDTTLAHRTMLQACRDHPLVLEQPEPNVFFVSFGDNSLSFEVRIFVSETSNVGRTRILHDLHMAIDQACREQGITIAFPQRDLHLKSVEAVLQVRLEDPAGRAGPGAWGAPPPADLGR